MMSSSASTYLLVHPRVERRREGVHGDRRHSERFVAHIAFELKSHGGVHGETIDVSRSGFLATAPILPPLRQPLMLTLALPDGPLALMAIVVRHTLVRGVPAMGVHMLGLDRQRELRWLHAVARLAEARHAEDLVTRELASPLPQPLRATEYAFINPQKAGDDNSNSDDDIQFDIDVVDERDHRHGR